MVIVEDGNYRHPGSAYWNFVFMTSDNEKQVSPFTVIKDRNNVATIKAVPRISELLEEKLDHDDVILQAWPGKYRTDVFQCYWHEFKKAYDDKKAYDGVR